MSTASMSRKTGAARAVSLSVLDRVGVAAPCPAAWDDMAGDARVRHCEQCSMNVYNLSEMSEEEATAFVLSHGLGASDSAQGASDSESGTRARVCIRLYRRADGTMITRNCPVGLAAVRARAVRMVSRAAAVIGMLLTGTVMLGARSREDQRCLGGIDPFASLTRWLNPTSPRAASQTVTMGEICMPPMPMTPAPSLPVQPPSVSPPPAAAPVPVSESN